MIGTTKQVAWAKQIKAAKLNAIKALPMKKPELAQKAIALLEAEEHAVFWIERRRDDPKALGNLACEAVVGGRALYRPIRPRGSNAMDDMRERDMLTDRLHEYLH